MNNMGQCYENDFFSYFKEYFETPFINPHNVVEIYKRAGMTEKVAFRKTVVQRNELVRGIELGILNSPREQRNSLMKALIATLGTTHNHFTNNERYGWEAIRYASN